MTGIPAGYNDRHINPATRMDHALYAFSAIPDRPPLKLPGGARVAIAVVINVDFGDFMLPADLSWKLPGTSASVNIREFSHRDYGPRVGVFRLMNILDEYGIKATMPVSDVLLERTPAVVEHAISRGWELVGHGAQVNRPISSLMSEEDESAFIGASYAAITAATGVAPRGWLSPALSESSRTPFLVAKAGFDYLLDWGNDDQPFDFLPPEGMLTALPYSPDTSDASVIQAQSHTPWEFEQGLRDHYEQLYAESEGSGRVMTLGLQAHVSGQPYRAKYIRSFLEWVTKQEGAWFATGSEIVDAYRAG